MEQELAAGLGEGQIAELVEDDEVEAAKMIGGPALAAVAGLGVEPAADCARYDGLRATGGA